MTNILFIYPDSSEKKNIRFGFSMNIAYSAAILKQNNCNCLFIDLSCEKIPLNDISSFILKNRVEIVVVEFDSYALKRTDNSLRGEQIIKYIKQSHPGIKTIAFGFLCVIEKIKIPFSDITIIDEPIGSIESAVKNLINNKNNYDYKPYELDSLPFHDRKFIETVPFYKINNHCTLVQTSKGCLNSCSFCQRRGWQKSRLENSVDYVVREFLYLRDNNYKNIWIIDENFSYNLPRAKNILRELHSKNITNNMKISISSWTKIDYEFLYLASKANISIISMGIENANQETLNFFKKNINLNNVRELIGYANSLGIFMVGNFIIGAPNENLSQIENTFNYIYSLKLDQVNIKILDYMIGSTLYETLDHEKYSLHHYFSCLENNLGQISLEILKKVKRQFLLEYKKENKERLMNKIKKYGLPYYPIFNG